MKTIFVNIAHGNEPYILGGSIGYGLGEVIIPNIYKNRQLEILKRWVGNNPGVYLDDVSGSIIDKILFHGDYADYISRVVANKKTVENELDYHLKDFEAVSLTGKRKRFRKIDIEINAGSPISTRYRSFYVFPGLHSEYASNSIIKYENVDSFVASVKETEERQQKIFIPKINSFSYFDRAPVKNEISTPPLKSKSTNNQKIERGILVSLPGSMVMAKELIEASKSSEVTIYHMAQDNRLPGFVTDNHEIIFNPNIMAVLARSGWGTLWLCQVAEKPIMCPIWKSTDDPEIYHNNITVEKFGLGVIYEKFNSDVLRKALSKADSIKRLNESLYDEFGTLDGIRFVQEKISSDLG